MDEAELEGLVDLEELWLGKNKIERIEGLTKVSAFRFASILVENINFLYPENLEYSFSQHQ